MHTEIAESDRRAEIDGTELYPPHNLPDTFTIREHDHEFTFYPKGVDRFQALLDHIASARKSVYCFWFLYEEDEIGVRVKEALIEAAWRGVETRLYIDSFGSGAEDAFFEDFVEAGGHFKQFASLWDKRFLIRNHQKMAIVDRKRVMGGGFNISNHYFASPEVDGWCDLGVKMEGPVVERFNEWYDGIIDFMESDEADFTSVRDMVRDWDAGDGPVRLIMGGPTAVSSEWAVRLKEDIASGERVDLVTAYFSPPRTMRRVLRKAARHSRLRMILASKSDFAITVLAARLHYRRLRRSGAQLFEYQPSKLHMKLMVIDDIVYFGSGNLDMRSIRLNLELMVRVESAELADRMRGLIDDLEAESRPIDKSWFKQYAGWSDRLRWLTSSFMLRFVDYNLSRRFNLGPSKLKNARRVGKFDYT
ncbi:MAG: phosphatidylserine/phosphatidylglycerophosphate/cardiolipin synthase family protein [Erythrobacter sp.]